MFAFEVVLLTVDSVVFECEDRSAVELDWENADAYIDAKKIWHSILLLTIQLQD